MKKVMTVLLAMVFVYAVADILKTSLNVTVRDDLGNLVAGASVQLYASKENWEKEENPIAEGTTDEKGVFKFKELNNLTIYILVRKDDKDNTGGGEQTQLLKGKINKVTVIIQ